MIDIISIIPGKKRKTASGWITFNGICCVHLGHRPDKRGRAGLKIDNQNSWAYACFNCHFKSGFILGKSLTKNTRLMLSWCGLSEIDIEKINFESFSAKDRLNLTSVKKEIQINFETRTLPENSVTLNKNNPAHSIHVDYLSTRGLTSDSYEYYVDDSSDRAGIIIPYFYENKIVGHTIRFYDSRKPKYISDQQTGYVFNIDNQQKNWSTCILVEGQFDAISINGCAYLGSNISDKQAAIISKLHRNIIVVPDRDRSGMEICNRALELGYKVSIPDWNNTIKDVNDAVKFYGKFPTLISILQSATNSRIKIEMARKKYK